MFTRVLLITLGALVFPWASLGGQTIQRTSCSLMIDKTLPGVYVSFQKAGPRVPAFQGESTKGIWLRIHNNYHFSILISTFPLRGDGDHTQGAHQERLGVQYEVKSVSENRNINLPSGYQEEIITMSRLQPREDITFSIPAEHLSESTYIQIPFEIECESRATGGGAAPKHFAVFYGSSLPKK
jgi:hypothetical protein